MPKGFNWCLLPSSNVIKSAQQSKRMICFLAATFLWPFDFGSLLWVPLCCTISPVHVMFHISAAVFGSLISLGRHVNDSSAHLCRLWAGAFTDGQLPPLWQAKICNLNHTKTGNVDVKLKQCERASCFKCHSNCWGLWSRKVKNQNPPPRTLTWYSPSSKMFCVFRSWCRSGGFILWRKLTPRAISYSVLSLRGQASSGYKSFCGQQKTHTQNCQVGIPHIIRRGGV